MTLRMAFQAKPVVSPATRQGSSMLTRRCACGTHTPGGMTCGSCASMDKGSAAGLKIGASSDRLEREADRIADRVMSAPAAASVAAAPLSVQRVAAGPAAASRAVPESIGRTLATPGQPLERSVRGDMEARFGHDFSQVRLHQDEVAAASSAEMGARAYTVGNAVVLGAGQYNPTTSSGQKLLAHELTHALQQRAAGADRSVVQRSPLDGLDDGRRRRGGADGLDHPPGGPLPFREATELAECIR